MTSPTGPAPPILYGLDVFVGGPIQHALGDGGFDEVLGGYLSATIAAVRAHGAEVFSAHTAEEFGARTAEFSPEQVAVRDFRWMDKCDVFVPILPCTPDGEFMRTDGTHIELGWASASGTPIVLLTEQPIPDAASHLLKGLPCIGEVRVVDVRTVGSTPQVLVDSIAEATTRHRAAVRAVAS